MVVPFVMAGVLMALAFGAHIFVGTRETLSLRPVAHPANTENMVRVPANHTELSRHWTQNPVSARTCRFDPGRRYSLSLLKRQDFWILSFLSVFVELPIFSILK